MDFDEYSQAYETELNSALSVTGETSDYFSSGRTRFLKQELSSMQFQPSMSLLDFGCGVGGNTESLMTELLPAQYVGVDPSQDSINRAQTQFAGSENISFFNSAGKIDTTFNLTYCNGVFHHIPVAERSEALQFIFEHTTPGGYFSIFENNPLNPGTQLVMYRCPFDRDAVKITPFEMVRLGQSAGFHYLRTRYLFFFPAFLKSLRFIEPALAWCPLGGQYLTIFQKPLA